MRFDLIDLRLFLAVVDAGSITHGAAEAGMSLPAASERLRDMEAAGEVLLLRRGRRGVSPTEAGEALAYHARNPVADVPWRHYADLRQMAHAVDILVVIVPGGAATRHLIDRPVFEALGPSGILINVARGSVVDEAALIRALGDGTIAAAGLDVFADEPDVPEALRRMDNVVLLPHVASATHFTRNAMGQLVVDNLLAWSQGRPPLTPVPETPWPAKA